MIQIETEVSGEIRDGLAWAANAERLAAWVMTEMVVRDDAHGLYYRKSDDTSASGKVDSPVDLELLRRHFAGEQIIGLYTISKADDSCRWLTIDIDRHDGDPDDEVERNDRFPRHLHDVLRDLGFDPLLMDSNGRGGRHLTVIFEAPSPAARVRSLGH